MFSLLVLICRIFLKTCCKTYVYFSIGLGFNLSLTYQTIKTNSMKTVHLEKKKSGNYYIVPAKTKTSLNIPLCNFPRWYSENIKGYTKFRASFGSRIIKATYMHSQTYFHSANEVLIYLLNKK